MQLARFLADQRNERMRSIQDAVCNTYGISRIELISKRRSFHEPRHIAMVLCRYIAGASLLSIGNAFERDHSSISYAVQKFENVLQRRTKPRAMLDKILIDLGAEELRHKFKLGDHNG